MKASRFLVGAGFVFSAAVAFSSVTRTIDSQKNEYVINVDADDATEAFKAADYEVLLGSGGTSATSLNLRKTGAGRLNMAIALTNATDATKSWTGTTYVDGGYLRVSHVAALGTRAAPCYVADGAAIEWNYTTAGNQEEVQRKVYHVQGVGPDGKGAVRTILKKDWTCGAIYLEGDTQFGGNGNPVGYRYMTFDFNGHTLIIGEAGKATQNLAAGMRIGNDGTYADSAGGSGIFVRPNCSLCFYLKPSSYGPITSANVLALGDGASLDIEGLTNKSLPWSIVGTNASIRVTKYETGSKYSSPFNKLGGDVTAVGVMNLWSNSSNLYPLNLAGRLLASDAEICIDGAQVTVADKEHDIRTLRFKNGGSLSLPDGFNLKVAYLKMGEDDVPDGTYTSEDYPDNIKSGSVTVYGNEGLPCVWTGAGGDGDLTNLANWEDAATAARAMASGFAAVRVVGGTGFVVNKDVRVKGLEIDSSVPAFSVTGTGTLGIGDGGLTIPAGTVTFECPIEPTETSGWTVSKDAVANFSGPFVGNRSNVTLTVGGEGTVNLTDNRSTYCGAWVAKNIRLNLQGENPCTGPDGEFTMWLYKNYTTEVHVTDDCVMDGTFVFQIGGSADNKYFVVEKGVFRINGAAKLYGGKFQVLTGAQIVFAGGLTPQSVTLTPGGSGEIVITNQPLTTALNFQLDLPTTFACSSNRLSGQYGLCQMYSGKKLTRFAWPYATTADTLLTQSGDKGVVGGKVENRVDLCGFDQQFGAIAQAPGAQIRNSGGPCDLHVYQTKDIINGKANYPTVLMGDLVGDITLVKHGTKTLTVTNTSISANGGIKVLDGTLEIASDATWAGANSLLVDGAESKLLVGARGASSPAVFAETARLDLNGGGTLQLDGDGTVCVGSFYVDGVEQTRGLWRHGDVHSAADRTSPFILGTGWLRVKSGPFARGLTFALVGTPAVPPAPARAGHQVRLCMIGDSITWWNQGDYWRKHLLDHMPELAFLGTHTGCCGYSHAGEGGDSTKSVQGRLNDATRVPYAPYYHLLIGINDCSGAGTNLNDRSKIWSSVATNTADRITNIVDRLVARDGTKKVFLGSILPGAFTRDDALIETPRGECGSAVNTLLRTWLATYSRRDRVVWVEYEHVLREPEMYEYWRRKCMKDVWLHPNETGYIELAKILAPVLKANTEPDDQTPDAICGVRVVNLWNRSTQMSQPLMRGWYMISFRPLDVSASKVKVRLLRLGGKDKNKNVDVDKDYSLTPAANGRCSFQIQVDAKFDDDKIGPACQLELLDGATGMTDVLIEKMRPTKKASAYGEGTYLDARSALSDGELIEWGTLQ